MRLLRTLWRLGLATVARVAHLVGRLLFESVRFLLERFREHIDCPPRLLVLDGDFVVCGPPS